MYFLASRTSPLLIEWRDSAGTHYRLRSRMTRRLLLAFRVTWDGRRIEESNAVPFA